MPTLKNITLFLNLALVTTLLGALILGIGGRFWMLLIGWILTGSFGITLGGTAEVILFGGMIGLAAGVVYILLIKDRIKRKLFEGTYFGLGTFVVTSFLPIDGKDAIDIYEPVFHFPIMLGFSILFFLYGVGTVWALNRYP